MNTQIQAGRYEGTVGINEKLSNRLSFAPQSPLLEESWQKDLFATFFDDTNAHSQRGHSSNDSAHEEIVRVAGTPLLHDEPRRVFRAKRPSRDQVQPSDGASQPNEDRLKLLARKYVAKEKLSDEQSARLEIVTARVRQLMPSVTVQEYEALEGVLLLLHDVSDTDKQLRAELAALESNDGDALSLSQK